MKSFLKTLCVVWGVCNLFSLSSCVQTKQIVYFQGDTTSKITLKVELPKAVTIQPKDILAVLVTSLDQETNTIFNLPNVNNLTYSNYSANSGMGKGQPSGYTVDSTGFISMPLIGKVNVKNLSTYQAADTITNRLKVYLKEPSVNIRILNHKFSVLGEVSRPSIYNFVDDKVTILEALGMAGDLTIFGKRDNILLIRENKDGERELVRLDITKQDILKSEYYYLQPNDVLYVEPLKTKATSTDQNYQLIPIITGLVSALGILILNLTR